MANFKAMERAYEDAVVGKSQPTAGWCQGSLILDVRPDLEEVIVPHKLYFVCAEGIIPIVGKRGKG